MKNSKVSKSSLHTDLLEDKYGSIRAKILKHDDLSRETHLIDNRNISRTFAITFFIHEWSEAIKNVNLEIKNGISIGVAFRSSKYEIRKNTIDYFIVKLPTKLKKEFSTKENFAKAKIYELYVKRKGYKPYIYGTVIEIYTPDFTHPIIRNGDILSINASTEQLLKIGFTRTDIWKEIKKNDPWVKYNQDLIMEAKKESVAHSYELKEMVKKYLKKYK